MRSKSRSNDAAGWVAKHEFSDRGFLPKREAGGVRFAASLQDGVLTEAQQLPKPDSKPTLPVASKKPEEGPEAAVHPALPRP